MSIRTADPRCRLCRQPLTDVISRHRGVGPDCWRKLTAVQQAKALALAARDRDPFHVPAARPPSVQARINNQNARAAVSPDQVQICARHGGVAGACPDCRREADPHRAAERILAELAALPRPERRAERARVLAARYAHVPEWVRPEWLRKDRTQHGRRTPTPPASPPVEQLELL